MIKINYKTSATESEQKQINTASELRKEIKEVIGLSGDFGVFFVSHRHPIGIDDPEKHFNQIIAEIPYGADLSRCFWDCIDDNWTDEQMENLISDNIDHIFKLLEDNPDYLGDID